VKIKSIDKPTVSVIRDVGASAAYWVATSTDRIYANRLSLTGSIGVIGSYLDFSDFIEEYNISYQRYVSGEFKDMGSPFKEPTKKEMGLFQDLINKMKEFFVNEVADNRNMTYEKVSELADGRIFLGIEAKELGLIDETGTKQDVVHYLETERRRKFQPYCSSVPGLALTGMGTMVVVVWTPDMVPSVTPLVTKTAAVIWSSG